jgi:hypothetical protein
MALTARSIADSPTPEILVSKSIPAFLMASAAAALAL